jgi:hypothetical protein
MSLIDRIMLRKSAIFESVIDQLKNYSRLSIRGSVASPDSCQISFVV